MRGIRTGHRVIEMTLLFLSLLLLGNGHSYSQEAGDGVLVEIPSPALRAVFFVPDAEAANTEIHFVVQSGEAENRFSEGLAHYLEHLAWLNTQDGQPGDYERHSNAWTTHFATGYWLSGAREDFADNVARLAGIFRFLDLDPDFMQEERDIIQREYESRIGRNPGLNVMQRLTSELYAGSGLARSVIGRPGEIGQYSIDDVIALHEETHRPRNTIALVYGDIDKAEVESVFAANFGTGAATSSRLISSALELPELVYTRSIEESEVSGITETSLIYRKLIHLPPRLAMLEYPQDIVVVELLEEILGSSLAGGLGRPLRFDAFIAREFNVELSLLEGSYLQLQFDGIPDRDVTTEQLLDAFESVLNDSAVEGIPDATFSRVKSRLLQGYSHPDHRGRRIRNQALGAISIGLAPYDLDTTIDSVSAADIETVNAVLKNIAGPGRIIAHVVRPTGTNN